MALAGGYKGWTSVFGLCFSTSSTTSSEPIIKASDRPSMQHFKADRSTSGYKSDVLYSDTESSYQGLNKSGERSSLSANKGDIKTHDTGDD